MGEAAALSLEGCNLRCMGGQTSRRAALGKAETLCEAATWVEAATLGEAAALGPAAEVKASHLQG